MIEVKVPSPGESISEVQLASWLVENGETVEKDQEIAEIDSDKATLTINAEEGGVITLLVEAGETIKVGTIVAQIIPGVGTPVVKTAVTPTAAAEVAPEKIAGVASIAVAPDVKKPVQPAAEPAVSAIHITPLAHKLMEERQISDKDILGHFTNLRISRRDVMEVVSGADELQETATGPRTASRETERKKMSVLRIKLA